MYIGYNVYSVSILQNGSFAADEVPRRPREANFGSEQQLLEGKGFSIREWRSDWQLELKTKLLQLGAQAQVGAIELGGIDKA